MIVGLSNKMTKRNHRLINKATSLCEDFYPGGNMRSVLLPRGDTVRLPPTSFYLSIGMDLYKINVCSNASFRQCFQPPSYKIPVRPFSDL